jgi:hypothetical protein
MYTSIGIPPKRVSDSTCILLTCIDSRWQGGLLGSQAVANDFKSKGIPVKAQIQFDMTAWVKKGTREEVGIITDYVDPGWVLFLHQFC